MAADLRSTSFDRTRIPARFHRAYSDLRSVPRFYFTISGRYQLDITESAGSGVMTLSQPAPPAFKESARRAQAGFYITHLSATDFNRFRQRSTPLLPKQIKRFIEPV
jgi:hypothetical protein